jgi:hypothetical protein
LRSCRGRDLTGFLGKVLVCSRERRGCAFERWLRTSYMADCGAFRSRRSHIAQKPNIPSLFRFYVDRYPRGG